jgi:transcription initiation factor TFIIIB Brf1 subunit/transcription initiation factor TFIIB
MLQVTTIEETISEICVFWDLNDEWFGSMVQTMMTALRPKKPYLHGVACIYIVCKLSGMGPSLLDIVKVCEIPMRIVWRAVVRIRQTDAYRVFRHGFVVPTTPSVSRVRTLCRKLSLTPMELDIVDQIRDDIRRSGRLTNRPATMDGVAIMYFQCRYQTQFSFPAIAVLVGIGEATIRKAYKSMYSSERTTILQV